MQSAYASRHNGPIFASIFSNKPANEPRGIATDRLVQFRPNEPHMPLILATHKTRYHNPTQRNNADLFFMVWGIDASGQNVLVTSPHFGVLRDHKFSPLPAGPGELVGAAW
jgi:hypothetical protein